MHVIGKQIKTVLITLILFLFFYIVFLTLYAWMLSLGVEIALYIHHQHNLQVNGCVDA